ncbi:MAG: electron transfer flavoprotein subunit beta/FixA family protein [Opitutaceae bacterium]|nr:electron transfer flavoprotein subunit beta/FixA family protein [Cytophagales bacterium]
MKILVCLGQVPDTTSKISFTDNNTKLNPAGVQFIIGPYDEYALSKAIDLREANGGTVTVFNVGLADAEPIIRKALAIGADDAVRVDSEPSDALFVATQIAEYAKDKNFDMILMGRESIDYNGGLVHGMVGEMLGIPSISPAMKLELDGSKAIISREIEGGKEVLEVPLPFVAGCQEPIAEWKIPNMRGIMSAKSKPLNVIASFNSSQPVGHSGYELPTGRTSCKMIDAANVEELVRLLKNEAKVI